MKDDSLISKVNTSFGKFTLDWFDFWNWQFSDFFSDLKILLIFNFLQTFNYKSTIVVSFEFCSQKVHSLTNSPRVPIECYHYLILSPKGELLLNNSLRSSIGLSDLCTICYWYRFFKLRAIHASYLQDKEDEKAFFLIQKNHLFCWTLVHW